MRLYVSPSLLPKILIPILLILPLSDTIRLPGRGTPENNRALLAATITSVQIPFIANQGQLDEEVSFYARTFSGDFFVSRDGEMVYSLRTGNSEHGTRKSEHETEEVDHHPSEGPTLTMLKERLVNARVIAPEGTDKAETKVNYFMGSDKGKWQTDIATYNVVSLGRVYENIDLSLKAYGKKVEKVFTVHPGGKVNDIRLCFEGATSLKTNSAGELEVGIPCSAFPVPSSAFVAFSAPIAFQEINGKRKEVQVAYDVRRGGRIMVSG
jgi:hypothetical protein